MLTRLIALDGGHDILVDGAPVVIGRDPGCDAQIASRLVSNRHCSIMALHGDAVVRDLGSTNGTWINGRRIEHEMLHPGDELSIAYFRYRLEIRHAE